MTSASFSSRACVAPLSVTKLLQDLSSSRQSLALALTQARGRGSRGSRPRPAADQLILPAGPPWGRLLPHPASQQSRLAGIHALDSVRASLCTATMRCRMSHALYGQQTSARDSCSFAGLRRQYWAPSQLPRAALRYQRWWRGRIPEVQPLPASNTPFLGSGSLGEYLQRSQGADCWNPRSPRG